MEILISVPDIVMIAPTRVAGVRHRFTALLCLKSKALMTSVEYLELGILTATIKAISAIPTRSCRAWWVYRH